MILLLINELIQSNQELNQQIKIQEAAIENLSSPHNSTGGNNDEVIKLKKQIGHRDHGLPEGLQAGR